MKPWKDVTLTDDYLFSQIMKDEAKGIRMDIYLEGDDEIYNIEMQTVHKTNLVKRMRYYHSAIDVDSLLRGNPYDQLKKSYVIFICNFDLCGDGLPVYESRTVWKQNGREIGDEQIKVVYNTSAFEKAEDPRLRALLQYLSTATVTDEARPIADKVAAFKRLYPEGRPHMKYELDLYDKWCEGKAEGVKEGIEQGLEKGIEIGENRGLIKGREEGIQQGRQESMRDIVYAAFEQGLSAEVIASLTHMPVDEVEKLRETSRT